MRKYLPVLLSLALTPIVLFLGLFLIPRAHHCRQLEIYGDTMLNNLWQVIGAGLLVAIKLGVGIVLFYLLHRFLPALRSQRNQTIFVLLAWGIIFFPAYRGAILSSMAREDIESLCAKTIGDVVSVRSINCSFPEYACLRGILSLLPDIPEEADSITVYYYRDGFLPDYTLKVDLRIPTDVEMPKEEGVDWMVENQGGSHQWMHFSEFVD